MFALGILALAGLCIFQRDFIIGRPPAWPASLGIAAAIGFLGGLICIVAAASMLAKRNIPMAALAIASCIILFSVLREIFFYQNDWLNSLKTLALLGGTFIVIRNGAVFGISTRNVLFQLGTLFLSVFFIASGYAHFKFAGFVTDFIPAYIPFRSFFAYFCGVCLLAGGIGLQVPRVRRQAALLSGIMVGGWFLLLHIPRFLADTSNASDRMGLCESFAFSGIFLMLAGTFGSMRRE